MQLEKLGIPTVGIVSSGFTSSYEARHKAMGLDVMPKIVVGPTLTEVSPERVREEVLARAQDLFRALTEQPEVSARPAPASQQQLLQYQGRDVLDALRNLNNDFLDRGWGDGFPLVPPTPEAVEEMLTGTSRGSNRIVSGRYKRASRNCCVSYLSRGVPLNS